MCLILILANDTLLIRSTDSHLLIWGIFLKRVNLLICGFGSTCQNRVPSPIQGRICLQFPESTFSLLTEFAVIFAEFLWNRTLLSERQNDLHVFQAFRPCSQRALAAAFCTNSIKTFRQWWCASLENEVTSETIIRGSPTVAPGINWRATLQNTRRWQL